MLRELTVLPIARPNVAKNIKREKTSVVSVAHVLTC